MLSRERLKREAGGAVYYRGENIYGENEVSDFVSVTEGFCDKVSAEVKGSGRKYYHVELEVDHDVDGLSSCSCECPAFYSYKGPCKHCVAVALEYLDYQKRQNYRKSLSDYLEEGTIFKGDSTAFQERPARRTASGYSPAVKRAPETTPAMKKLLSKQMVKRSLPIAQREINGRVSLEPTLYINRSEITVEFRIGINHKYVLKDVFAFAKNMERNEDFSYGQKLQFIHDIRAFAPESKQLALFVCNWAANNEQRYLQNRYYGYNYDVFLPKLRNFPLSMDELDGFLSAMGERSFLANVDGRGDTEWKITGEPLVQELQIEGKERGIELYLPSIFCVITGKSFVYFKENLIYPVSKAYLEPVQDFLKCMDSLPNRKVFIQKTDVPAFCRELLPALEKCFTCNCENFNKENYGVSEASFEIYLDAPQRDLITCRVMAVYGEQKYNVYSKDSVEVNRDMVQELEIGKLVSEYCNAYDEENACMVLSEDDDKLYELLTEGVAAFQAVGEVFISDALKHVRVTSAPKATLGVSLAGDLLELTVTTEDMPLEQLQEILSKYNRKKKYYRLKNGDFVSMEGEDITALLEMREGLGLSDAQLKAGKAVVPKFRALYLDAESREWESLSVTKDKEFRALVRNMKTVEDNDFEIPSSLQTVMREYQKRGFLWLKTLKNNGFGGILADDMGLGKTLQVLAFLQSENDMEKAPVLIVCPASLVFNWNSEIERFAPTLPTKMIVGTAAERKEILAGVKPGEILLTSYDLLKRDIDHYEDMQFSCQVIDEAQYIKNHNTQVAKAVKRIQAGFKLALTGTPIENRLSELWSIFDYLMPGFLYSYPRFKSDFEMPIVQEQEEASQRRLQKMIRPFVLRRLKRDVLKDLPDKLEENLYVRMEGEQQKLYDAHVKRLLMMLGRHSDEEFKRNKIEVLAELTKLRQLCCDPSLLYEDYKGESAKMQLCVDMVKNAVSGGHKILLFSQFTTMLSHICDCLKQEGIAYYVLTGATSKEKRKELVEAFQKDDTPVFCISLKAGGTGLNLTAADMVLHYDPWWNQAVQNQATDRAHRIGQKNVVNVYKLIAKDTIEEKIVALQDKKKELAEQLLGGEGMDSTSFSREELLELLKN